MAMEISVLNKIRYAINVKAVRIYESHPLANKSLERRMQYMVAVAFVLAVNAQPNHLVRAEFIELARGLGIDEREAKEQLQVRANVSEDDIKIIFDIIKDEKYSGYYFVDVCWIYMVCDGFSKKGDNAIITAIAELMGIKNEHIILMHNFLYSIKKATKASTEDYFGEYYRAQFDSVLYGATETLCRRK